MASISNAHFIDNVAAALQYISSYHPPEYIAHLVAAHSREESDVARAAIEQILVNSRMSAIGRRALCQDTGTVNVWLRIGMNVRFEGDLTPGELVNAAVRRAWADEDNPLRASIVADPLFARSNTRDNTPAMVSIDLVGGEAIEVSVMAKGGGSENKSRFATLRPSDSIEDWIMETLPTLGAGWCPPGMLGIGVGGSADVAMRLAKESLYEPPNMAALRLKNDQTPEEQMRVRICDKINSLGIGAQGLGGLTALLDVKLKSAPTHASALPVALIPQCVATRMVSFKLTETGGFDLATPNARDWPEFSDAALKGARRVDLDTLTAAEKASWRAGDTLLLSGHILTGRDAAHRRMIEALDRKEPLPVDLNGRAIYYVGPVEANSNEVVGPAGPTTSTRMDKFTPRLLAETGLGLMIGKAERGPDTVEAIREYQAPYLIAVGGAAVLVSRAIRESKVLAYHDLGMEAVHEFRVEDMPVIVAVDISGDSIHVSGPRRWRRPAA